MKKSFFFLPVWLALMVLMACHSPKNAQKTSQAPPPKIAPKPQATAGATQVAWVDSERLMPVLELATKENKPVFVVFYATWCAPCKVLEEDILTQPALYTFLNKNFLNFRTDFDSPAGRTIAEIYSVEKLPTVLFLKPNGVVAQQHTGAAGSALLMELGAAALKQ